MSLKKRVVTYLVFSIPTLMLGQTQNNFSGYLDNYMISGLSDGKIIKIPFRMLNLNWKRQSKNFEFNSNLAMEFRLKNDPSMVDSELNLNADLSWIIRELFLTWYIPLGEIRVGKQINTWGLVDENSPLDVVNAFDYYYLFFQGTERKIGSNSIAMEFYLNDWKLGGVFSPFHQKNRLPANDPEFPIKIPIVPKENQIFEINETPIEFGGFVEYPFNWGDLRFSFFQGYDRVFNLSGVNAFTIEENDPSFTEVDIVYGYRKTNVIGWSAVGFIQEFVLRGDFAMFRTKDMNSSVKRESPFITHPYHYKEFPLRESADYYQFTLQFEYGLPWDISIAGQFFSYDTIQYKSGELPIDENINIPNLEIDPEDLNPKNFFTPGMGTPMAVLSKRFVLLTLEKTFLDDQLKINSLSLVDIAKPKESEKSNIWGAMF